MKAYKNLFVPLKGYDNAGINATKYVVIYIHT